MNCCLLAVGGEHSTSLNRVVAALVAPNPLLRLFDCHCRPPPRPGGHVGRTSTAARLKACR